MRLSRQILIAAACLLMGAGCRDSIPEPDPYPSSATAIAPLLSPSSPSPVTPLAAESIPVATRAPTPGTEPAISIPPMPPRDSIAFERERPTLEADHIGAVRTFRVADLQAAGYREVQATLQYTSTRVTMWVEEGATASREGLAASARAIEERILPVIAQVYPDDAETIGLTYSVLNVQTSGTSGYYAAPVEAKDPGAPPLFVMNLAALRPGTEQYNGVLAHEMQHVHQAATDPNEAAWVTEGASQLLETLAGYPVPMDAVSAYAAAPGVQLNTLSADDGSVFRHYGASFLMLQYFYERHGLTGLQMLLNAPEEGTAAFEDVLASLDGSAFRDLYADWTVANFLDAPKMLDGKGGYAGLDLQLAPQNSVSTYPVSLAVSLPPYAAQYIELSPEQGRPLSALTVRLDGPAWTRLVPADVPSGTSMWWSNRGDAGHSWLERRIDLRGVTQATLTFDLWYDIEWGWDWAGVRVSQDGGEQWTWVEGLQSVAPPAGTSVPYAAYTGRSGVEGAPLAAQPAEWVAERIDLALYAGREILVRFDMLTDDALNQPGLCIDNLAIDAIGWRDEDAVSDEEWVASGFVRIDNRVPVEYLVQAVTYAADEIALQRMEATGARREWRLADPGRVIDRAVLIVSAITDPNGPISTEEIPFTLSVEPAP